MEGARFDTMTRSLSRGPSRRRVLGGVLAALGLGAVLPAGGVAKKTKLKRNKFGCVNVGDPCRGKDKNCCSGICKGKKPKQGERDKSECVEHDASTCQRGQQQIGCGGAASVSCTTTAGAAGQCDVTTGKAAYCAADGDCFPCKRDTDCEGVCGQGAACIRCTACPETGGTACAGTSDCTV